MRAFRINFIYSIRFRPVKGGGGRCQLGEKGDNSYIYLFRQVVK